MLLALNPTLDPAQAIRTDRFSESRIGLDHLSLSVASIAIAIVSGFSDRFLLRAIEKVTKQA